MRLSAAPRVLAAPSRKRVGWLRGGVAALACALLVVLFSLALFPYERLRGPVEAQLASQTGAQVEIGRLEGGLGWAGPELRGVPVTLRWPQGESLELTEARVRPALSMSWLRGVPALAIALAGPDGSARGTAWAGEQAAFRGRLEDVDLARLPGPGGLPLSGRGDVDLDLRVTPAGLVGSIRLDAREGSLALPDPPLALPYERLQGELRLAADAGSELEGLSLEGPLLAVRGGGSIGQAARPELAPLDLVFEVEVRDASFRPVLAGLGLPLDAGGRGRVQIQGSAARPRLR